MAEEKLVTATNPKTGQKVVLRNGSWVPVVEPPSLRDAATALPFVGPFFDKEKGAGRLASLAEGATFGASGEIGAGLSSPFIAAKNAVTGRGPTSISDIYNQKLSSYDRGLAEFREKNPLEGVAYELLGGIPSGMGLAKGAATVASKAPALARLAQPTNSRILNNLGRTAKAGAIGASEAALYGFNTGQGGFQNRLANAGDAAEKGGKLSAALSVAGTGGRLLGEGIQNQADTLREIGLGRTGRSFIKKLQSSGKRLANKTGLQDYIDEANLIKTDMHESLGEIKADIIEGKSALKTFTNDPEKIRLEFIARKNYYKDKMTTLLNTEIVKGGRKQALKNLPITVAPDFSQAKGLVEELGRTQRGQALLKDLEFATDPKKIKTIGDLIAQKRSIGKIPKLFDESEATEDALKKLVNRRLYGSFKQAVEENIKALEADKLVEAGQLKFLNKRLSAFYDFLDTLPKAIQKKEARNIVDETRKDAFMGLGVIGSLASPYPAMATVPAMAIAGRQVKEKFPITGAAAFDAFASPLTSPLTSPTATGIAGGLIAGQQGRPDELLNNRRQR